MENIIDHNQRSFLITPLDHREVIKCRPDHFLYPAVLARIERDRPAIDAFRHKIGPFCEHANLDRLARHATKPGVPFWGNGYFDGGDARAVYGIIAAHRPAHIVEIGSGNSTMFMRQAIRDFSLETKITSIDPVPRAEIDAICDVVVRRSVLDVELAMFSALEPNDILFMDGSHLTFNGTDTVRLFLEILPVVAAGVMVHIHDINLPKEYTRSFDQRGYSEQYMLGAALLFSDELEVLLPVNLLHEQNSFQGGVSFWFHKRKRLLP
jgi:predicted O-methyltransferase YrrM